MSSSQSCVELGFVRIPIIRNRVQRTEACGPLGVYVNVLPQDIVVLGGGPFGRCLGHEDTV